MSQGRSNSKPTWPYPGAPSSIEAEGGRTIRRLKMAVGRDPVFLHCLSQPELTCRLQQLLGDQVVMPLDTSQLYHDQATAVQ